MEMKTFRCLVKYHCGYELELKLSEASIMRMSRLPEVKAVDVINSEGQGSSEEEK